MTHELLKDFPNHSISTETSGPFYRSSGWEILQSVVSVFPFPYPICVPFSLMRKSPFLNMMIF